MIRKIKSNQGTKSGIYKITNLVNQKFYIGSTKHISSRYRSHLYSLKRNKSTCTILQNAVNKYGIENFEFSVLEVCDNYKEREIEIFSNGLPSYNIIKENFIRREVSEETKKKMSLSRKGKASPLKGIKKPNYKRYSRSKVILKNNEEILTFQTVKECAEYFNCTQTAIYQNFYRKTLLRHLYKIMIIKP